MLLTNSTELVSKDTLVDTTDVTVRTSEGKLLQRITPYWCEDLHTLLYGEIVVKSFRNKAAANQVKVLRAFEEEGWPPTVYDPLYDDHSIGLYANPKKRRTRLRVDTLAALNRNQKCPILCFRACSNGERIRWEINNKVSFYAFFY